MQRELFVSRLGGQLWSALREDGKVVELRVENARSDAPVGRIIKARVTNILPGIQSAFLDIGTERGGFLHVKDLVLPGETWHLSAIDPEQPGKISAGRSAGPPIQDRLTVGRDMLVQITRERLRSKGAKVTSFISLAGRLIVLMPQAPGRGVSRKIQDQEERERLLAILRGLPTENVGLVARTAAEGAAEEDLRADAESLMRDWCEIQDRSESLPAPSVVHPEAGLLLRLIRETPREGLERIVFDDERDHGKALALLSESEPELATKVGLHAAGEPLFERHRIDDQIARALRPKVWLKSGGYVVIEETEALVSIDVNTGKYLGRQDLEQTALRANREAAREIARQLRLRDLGGIIVIDFIDVGEEESRRLIVAELEEALRSDPARTKVVGLSELGLLQLTRKRTRPALGTALTRSCPLCRGRGRIKAPRTVAAEVLRALRRSAAEEDARFTLRVHPDTASAIGAALAEEEAGGSGLPRRRVRVEQDRSLRPDGFELNLRPEDQG